VSSPLHRIKRIQQFLDEKEIFRQDASKLPRWRRVAHFWVLVMRSFQRNRGPVRAASLAYTTLLALVPVLAVVVSVSTGFLKSDNGKTVSNLVGRFIETVAPQLNLIPESEAQAGDTVDASEEAAAKNSRQQVADRIMTYINTINSGTLGVTAGIALVFIAVTLLSTVENTFNDMWGVTRGRPWLARIVQYWAAITLGPLFIVTAVGLTTGSEIQRANAWLQSIPLMGFFAKLLPFIVFSIFLTLFYKIMPATKVRWDAAFVGGMAGGVLLQLNNLFNVLYISRVATYSKIYGGLSAVPIFLVGMYFSWLIVLLGSQVAYAYQNKQAYVQEKQAESVHQRGKEFIALRMVTFIAKRFSTGEKPPTRQIMSDVLGIPSQLACQVLPVLVQAKLLVEVQGDETGYVPGRPLDRITVEDVLDALRTGQGSDLVTREDEMRAILRDEYERVTHAEMHAAGSVSLQTLVARASSLPPHAPAAAMAS
jgi:membrane protein